LAAFDFDAALRWARFDRVRTLPRRDPSVLPYITDDATPHRDFLLDTSVYIHRLQGRLPEAVSSLVDARRWHHSSVAVQELMHAVGALDPTHPGTPVARRQIGALIKAMHPHRSFVPDEDVSARGALLAGIVSRMQGYAKDARFRAMHDCMLFLQAHKLGLTVLTANVADFDILLQLIPSGRAMFYRTV
jgi:predicted nucleic acid-binding protein